MKLNAIDSRIRTQSHLNYTDNIYNILYPQIGYNQVAQMLHIFPNPTVTCLIPYITNTVRRGYSNLYYEA